MRWISPKRLLPLITALIALGIDIAHRFKLVDSFDVEAAILFVLALLAFDALVERLSVIDKIEGRLASLESPSVLRDRSAMVGLEEMAKGASTLDACGATLISLSLQRYDFFLEQLTAGKKMRFVVLDPASPAWKIWNDVKFATPADIDTTLQTFGALMKEKTKGSIEVRLSSFVLPSSLLIGDGSDRKGRMNVEFAFSGTSLRSRPHVHLTRRSSPEWFEFFSDRFEELWKASKPYTPAP